MSSTWLGMVRCSQKNVECLFLIVLVAVVVNWQKKGMAGCRCFKEIRHEWNEVSFSFESICHMEKLGYWRQEAEVVGKFEVIFEHEKGQHFMRFLWTSVWSMCEMNNIKWIGSNGCSVGGKMHFLQKVVDGADVSNHIVNGRSVQWISSGISRICIHWIEAIKFWFWGMVYEFLDRLWHLSITIYSRKIMGTWVSPTHRYTIKIDGESQEPDIRK